MQDAWKFRMLLQNGFQPNVKLYKQGFLGKTDKFILNIFFARTFDVFIWKLLFDPLPGLTYEIWSGSLSLLASLIFAV